jgi:hypothetical protein
MNKLYNWNKDCEICGEHFSENERCICPCHKKPKEIVDLEKEIEYEQNQYDIACEYPTETDQFYKGLERTRQRIEDLKVKLQKLYD